MVKRLYTSEEIEIMKDMLFKGFSYTEIGEKVNRSRKSVRNKLVNLGYAQPENIPNKDYVYKVDEIVNDSLIIVEKTRSKKGNMRAYIVQSVKYPEAPTYIINERSLMSGCGDGYLLSGGRTFEGNSLYSIEKYRDYLVDVEYAKTIRPTSNIKTLFKCPYCKETKFMTPNKFVNGGLRCQRCSSHSYYPELLFSAVNNTMKLGYVNQQVFDDFKDYRFDFVNYNKRIIVETHGAQHYNKNHKWYRRTAEADVLKRNYCRENNWTLVELDCRKSEFKFIKNNINACEYLPNIKEEDVKHILEYIEYNKRHDVKNIVNLYEEGFSTLYIGEKYKLDNSTIRNILQKNNITLRKPGTKIKCVNTGRVFNTVKEASEWLGKNDKGVIRQNIRGEVKYAHKHPETGERLTWSDVEK